MGLEKKSFFNYAVGAAILMILTLALPKYVGIYAVAIGGAAGSVVTSFLNLNALNKKARILDNPKKTALAILLSFPLVALTCLLKNLLFSKFRRFRDCDFGRNTHAFVPCGVRRFQNLRRYSLLQNDAEKSLKNGINQKVSPTFIAVTGVCVTARTPI